MAASYSGLHARYRLQATWTAAIRRRLLADLPAERAGRILEVGSGTGVITSELSDWYSRTTYGVDIDPAAAAFSASYDVKSRFAVADGAALPFPDGGFDACVCHFLLLWVADPAELLREMVRVTCSDGHVIAMAEPDYCARIDYPVDLEELGTTQAEALRDRGADPSIGRKLRALLNAAGLTHVVAGVLGGEWSAAEDPETVESEWRVLENDLSGLVEPDRLAAYREMDERSRVAGERILFVPTFFASGQVA